MMPPPRPIVPGTAFSLRRRQIEQAANSCLVVIGTADSTLLLALELAMKMAPVPDIKRWRTGVWPHPNYPGCSYLDLLWLPNSTAGTHYSNYTSPTRCAVFVRSWLNKHLRQSGNNQESGPQFPSELPRIPNGAFEFRTFPKEQNYADPILGFLTARVSCLPAVFLTEAEKLPFERGE